MATKKIPAVKKQTTPATKAAPAKKRVAQVPDVELLVSGVEFTSDEVAEIEQFVLEVLERKTGRKGPGVGVVGFSAVACVM